MISAMFAYMFFFHVFEPQMDEDNPTTTASTESNMTPLWFTRGGTHNVGRVCVLNVHLWLSIREPVAFSRRINSVFWARSRSMTGHMNRTGSCFAMFLQKRFSLVFFRMVGQSAKTGCLCIFCLRLFQHREDLSPGAPWSGPPEKKTHHFPP